MRNLPVPKAETIRELVQAAHAAGLPVLMHASSIEAQAFGLDTGVDIMAHGLWGRNDASTVTEPTPAIKTVLDGVLAKKKVKSEARLAFTRKLGPLLLTSASYAASTQLDEMHKQVMTWKADMTAAEWRQLCVLIPGSSPPRKDNLRTQYFARLLGEKGEGERIMCAEALFDESRSLNLLASYQLDTVIGTDFFDNPASMHRDLLGDGAAAHLKKMSFDQAK